MAKFILKTLYYRNHSSFGKFVQYIGTREGVEKLPDGKDMNPATKKQQELVNSIVNRSPETKNYPEYAEYELKSTKSNAAEFIETVIENDFEGAENLKGLMNYIAERPGVEKLGSHGLFSQRDEKIDLKKTAERVAEHNGIVWSHVLSLNREDAERLGYNKAQAWKRMLRRNMIEIARAHQIKPTDLEWYAAYHDTTYHPHVHLIVFSKDGQGFLKKDDIKKLKKLFANDIFREEQHKLFVDQTQVRDELKDEANEHIDKILHNPDYTYFTPKLQELFPILKEQLSQLDGKKSYGYLPKSVKKTVDEILDEVLKSNENLKNLYHKWNEINREKLSLYYDSSKYEDIPITENKEFRSVKNAIIKLALSIDMSKDYWWEEYHTGSEGYDYSERITTGIIGMIIGIIASSASNKLKNLGLQSRKHSTDKKQRQKIREKKMAMGHHPKDEDEDDGFTMSM